MIKSTLGAPFGGTTEGGQYGLESAAVSLITPPNFGSGGGSCLPSMVVVAPGEPGVPVICWAEVEPAVRARTEADNANARMVELEFMVSLPRKCFVAEPGAERLLGLVFCLLGLLLEQLFLRRKVQLDRQLV